MRRNESKKIVAGSIAVCAMMILMGAAAVNAQSAGYELSVKTNALQYYEVEKVITSGNLLKDGAGVPGAIIFLTYIDPNQVPYHGPSLGILTDKEGRFEYTFILPKEAPVGQWTVKAVCRNPTIEATNTFSVVSKTIVVEANGPYEGTMGVPIQFTGSATGGKIPYTWKWKFGDGGISDQQNPSYAYTAAGTYTAELTVIDFGGMEGLDTAQVTIITEVNLPPNKPTITGPTSGDVGVEYTYTVVATDPNPGDTVAYYVDWGDGTHTGWTDFSASGAPVQVKHTWTGSGAFAVKVKAKDIHELEGPWSDVLTMTIQGEGATLDVTFKGKIGLTFVINNTGNVDASNVQWNLTIEKGFIFKPKTRTIEGSVASIAVGQEHSVRTILFGVGRVRIYGDITADNAPTVHVDFDCFVIGIFILMR